MGGLRPSRGEIASALSAARGWAQARDLPDPAGYVDLAAQPEVFYEQFGERVRQDRFPIGATRFPLPKPGGTRNLTWLDPYDDMGLRVLVGRMTAMIKRACDRAYVFSYPLASTGPGWSTLSHRHAQAQRRDRGISLLNDPRCRALGVFDVAEYYASIDLDVLADQLLTLNAPAGAVRALRGALESLAESTGVTGLPIGFEGSGPLANIYLLPADDVAASVRLGFVRYTDDSWLFLPQLGDWQYARDEYESRLARLGLHLNETKTQVHDAFFGDAAGIIRHGLLDSITEGDTKRVSADEAVDILNAATEEPDGQAFRFAMGALKNDQDPRGLEHIEAHCELFDQEPKVVADYLVQLAKKPAVRRRIDPEWIVDIADRPGNGRTLAGQLHACRVAYHLHLNKKQGERVHELARSSQHQGHIPLQVWAATAWTTSDHWKDSRATEAARDKGTLSVRRAFVLGFENREPGKSAVRHIRELARIEPDLRPTIEFVLA